MPVRKWAVALAVVAVFAGSVPALAAGAGPEDLARTGGAARTSAPRAVAAAPLPDGLGPCLPGRCPDPYPPVHTGDPTGEDRGISIFVGGDFRVRGRAAEAEGKVVVLGGFDQDKDPAGSSVYNIGIVGAGSQVRPPLRSDFLTTGGNVAVAAGERLIADGGVVRHAGTLTGTVDGTKTQDANAATPYLGLRPRLTAASQCYARVDGNPRTPTGRAVNNGYATVFTGDGTSALQVFNVGFDLVNPGTGGPQGLEFANIPARATILVNLTGAARTISTYSGESPYRDRLLWNFPDATRVDLTGSGQFQGSVLVGQDASATTVSLPGMNGRFFTAGSLTHTSDSAGAEFHAYPFNGDLPSCGDDPVPPARGEVRVQKVDAATGTALSGAEFRLWRETNGTAGLQTGGTTPDTAVTTCTTPPSGGCASTVPVGTYYWQETAAPAGYDLPSPAVFGPLELTAENASAGVGITARNTRTPEPPARGEVRVRKVDAETGAALPGAAFRLWRETNGTAGLQTAGMTPDTAVATCTTPTSGGCVATVEVGTYYWQETAAPTGYDLPSPAVFGPLELTAGNASAGVEITARNTRTPEPPARGRIVVLKTDSKTGRPLEGAVFELWRETNATAGLQTVGINADELVDAGCATGERGECRFEDLPAGEYYLNEIDVPEGYVLPRNPVTGPVRVTEDNGSSEVTLRLTNKRGEPDKGGKGPKAA
ncbi:choice-of-anchor A family protein [Streptomyces sp. NPDC101132]|uniref:choice-of-anchor A family protein n=1 Tax=Streptomyces sp. NPDC101132 TaxID=3366110 RepID=UPI00382E3467